MQTNPHIWVVTPPAPRFINYHTLLFLYQHKPVLGIWRKIPKFLVIDFNFINNRRRTITKYFFRNDTLIYDAYLLLCGGEMFLVKEKWKYVLFYTFYRRCGNYSKSCPIAVNIRMNIHEFLTQISIIYFFTETI